MISRCGKFNPEMSVLFLCKSFVYLPEHGHWYLKRRSIFLSGTEQTLRLTDSSTRETPHHQKLRCFNEKPLIMKTQEHCFFISGLQTERCVHPPSEGSSRTQRVRPQRPERVVVEKSCTLEGEVSQVHAGRLQVFASVHSGEFALPDHERRPGADAK